MKLRHLLHAAALLLSAVGGAVQAANYQMLPGQNVDFYYDTDYWGANTATVSGNSIFFDVSGYDASATSFGSRNRTEYVHESSGAGIIVVARDEFLLAPVLRATSLGDYTLAANGSHVELNLAGSLSTGTFNGSVYTPTISYLGNYFSGAFKESTGLAESGTFGKSDFAYNNGSGERTILGVEVSLTALASQTGVGTTSAQLNTARYDFYIENLVVPEPQVYAMLLAGLGLIGLRARRRA
ncbi:PEP-CTERM protein-sorting domain-containing protein [Duganella sp. CF402]|uniref:PEP-CTERM sorting domain-containing protein n=1 Tax=unclassified Duganella TaxID=2636909 RepID=UPI0008BC9824|nr:MULTISPECIES: PEP-CTERM sorting domain-containing protein [unclassified Duganella]RZT10597.1 putative secreted protein with PEP-CTERM sorting signal [Duganella sp. BK701]SEL06702.1 PEP-CTERM protein-sorting domain-containing protein [Duganella sp. CF402]